MLCPSPDQFLPRRSQCNSCNSGWRDKRVLLAKQNQPGKAMQSNIIIIKKGSLFLPQQIAFEALFNSSLTTEIHTPARLRHGHGIGC